MVQRRSNNNKVSINNKSIYGGDARGLYGKGLSRGSMIYGKPKRRWPKVLIFLLIVVIIIAALWQFAFGGLPFFKGGTEEAATQQSTSQSTAQTTTPKSSTTQSTTPSTYVAGLDTTIQISAMGDCTLGTDESFDTATNFTSVYKSVSDPAYFFANVKKYTSADDLSICNFEGTLTTSTARADKTYAFKAPASYAQILVDGSVEAANMANNHALDYGEQGYTDTKKALAKYGITTFASTRTAVKTINKIKVGLLGIDALSGLSKAKSTMKSDVATLKSEGCALIIGDFHWGTEGEYTPDTDQVTLAHAAVDAGCDLVIGGHPHVLQGVEKYNNRYILYSLGNFCFGGNDSPTDYNTMMYQQTFTFKNGQLVMDEDTEKAADIIPCSVSSSSTHNDFQPTPLTGSAGSKLVSKVNGYSAKLSGDGVDFSTTLSSDGRAAIK